MKLTRLASAGVLTLAGSFGMLGTANAGPAPAPAPAVVVQPPAVAAGLSSCPSSYLCFWYLQNYSSYMGKVSGNNSNWAVFSRPECPRTHTWSDCAESAYNHGTQCTVYLFDATGYAGGYHSLARGDRTPNMFGDYLNRVSSNRWCSPK